MRRGAVRLFGPLRLAVLLAVLLAGCGGGPAPSTGQSGAAAPAAASKPAAEATRPPERLPLKLAYTAITANQALFWIGVEAGLFEQEGLDVELLRLESSARALPAMLSGEVPISMLASGAVATVASQGADVVLIAGSANRLVFQLMVPPSITSPEQLRGQPVGVSGRGGAGDFATRFALRRFGLDPDQDVVIRVVPGGDAGLSQALLSGQFFAGALGPPSDLRLEQAGFRSLARLSDYDVPYTGTGPATTRSYLASHRETVKRFLRGYLASIHRAKTDPAYAQAVMRQYTTIDDDRALEWGYQQYLVNAIEPLPYPSEAGLQTVMEGLVEEVPDVLKLRPADLLDLRLLQELEAEGVIGQLYR